MKHNIYPKLAWTGIKKNKRLYLPYILTCIGMVMMFYIVSFLSVNEYLGSCKGGEEIQQMLVLGSGVIGVFATIFLFYTNSFLMRRRKKEFGLYNILGMGKWNIARVLLWEGVMIAAISLAAGLFGGILFSKIGELCMVNILEAKAVFSMSVEKSSVVTTMILFSVIFALILLNGLRQLHGANPIELLHSENTGEKPPRGNWLFALCGTVLLCGAYYLAVTIENPLAAMIIFFIAVVMVIVATYLLFVSGSVTICRGLQKNKKYYYKTNHFVSVSSMVYRMKRNGAGLASICILCTMVLVMVSSTVCLYIGKEDSLRSRYPRDINITVRRGSAEKLEDGNLAKRRAVVDDELAKYNLVPENILDYRIAAAVGLDSDGKMDLSSSSGYDFNEDYTNVWQIYLVPLEDYNKLMGENETLEPGEAFIYTTKNKYHSDKITLGSSVVFEIKKVLKDFVDNGEDSMQILPSIFLFVPNYEEVLKQLSGVADYYGNQAFSERWMYAFDLSCTEEKQIEIYESLKSCLSKAEEEFRKENLSGKGIYTFSIESFASERTGFYALYGGLFFLGVLLGIVFVFAAVLIMYYKQVSEGYEDQARFEIMQNVGMTKAEIKKSVSSQVLTVFFLPLLAAGMHLGFAFPLVRKLLLLFGLVNLKLIILVTLSCFLVFALMYILVYRTTSRAYYTIVSGMGN